MIFFKGTGEFDFWQKGGNDGFDTINWITNQSWSNGVVFSFGISADGINALTELLLQPNQLKAQFIIWASGDGHGTSYQGGAFREQLIEGWLYLILRPEFIPIVKQNENFGPWWYNLTFSSKCKDIHIPSVHYGGW